MNASRVGLCAAAACSALLGSSPSWAQAAGGAAGTVEELVVTAQKRDQALSEVPAAISALSGADLESRGVTNVEGLQLRTPSLQYGSFSGVSVVSIRGVGLNQIGAGVQPGVAIHMDGVYQARTMMGELAQMDLERAEVLRGPQGTLYGRNATGGVINFISRAPTDQAEGYLLAGYGNYADAHLQGMVNMPVNSAVRARLAVDYDDRQDGFIKNVVPGLPDLDKDRQLALRGRVAADLSSDLTLDLIAYGMQASGSPVYEQWYGTPTLPGNPIVPTEPRRTSANDPTKSRRSLGGLTAIVNWDLGWAKLKSTSAYYDYMIKNRFDADAVNLSLSPSYNQITSHTFTQEFDLSGQAGPLDWLGGLYYLDDAMKYASRFDFPQALPPILPAPGFFLITGQSPYDTTSYAAFADGTWRLSDRLRVVGGVRYSDETVKLTQINDTGVGASYVVPNACYPPKDLETSFHAFTPRLGLQYDVSGDDHAYATVSRGFKAGGFNSGSCGNAYAPEKLTAYEAGYKMRFAGGRAALDLSAFYYDYTDLQLQQYVNLSTLITNAQSATIKGLEAQGQIDPDRHWSFDGSLSLLDATYDRFETTDTLNPTAGVQDLSGHRLNRAPKVSGNLGAQYRTADIAGVGRLTLRGEVYASSRVYYREFGAPLDSQKAYSVVNLFLIWDSLDGRYTARLYARNLADTAYINSMGSTAAPFYSRFVTWAPPRQVGADLRVRF